MCNDDVVEVTVGVIFKDGRYLIAQRRPEDSFALFWEFPGGKRKRHESLEESLKREILEELGIEVEVGNLIQQEDCTGNNRRMRLYFFQCKIYQGVPSAIDCHDFKWVNREELKQFSFPPADENLILKLSDV